MTDDEQARRERAERLRRKIDELRSGEADKGESGSPREFLDEQAREEMDRRRSREKAAEEEEKSR